MTYRQFQNLQPGDIIRGDEWGSQHAVRFILDATEKRISFDLLRDGMVKRCCVDRTHLEWECCWMKARVLK